ncbi:LMBR1 domain-containing protein 2 homolog A-like [Macadamia integrifolia]|uniref:LMBR1 domain-containing protein 2 homolog A-like n=1 Tax=Macadamia integrifolia TaxID=60698 RepID=UPI001C4EEC6A|nr:LMBR1 domain-containing protein 2 homolog A-like [Macadamia integrifolia]
MSIIASTMEGRELQRETEEINDVWKSVSGDEIEQEPRKGGISVTAFPSLNTLKGKGVLCRYLGAPDGIDIEVTGKNNGKTTCFTNVASDASAKAEDPPPPLNLIFQFPTEENNSEIRVFTDRPRSSVTRKESFQTFALRLTSLCLKRCETSYQLDHCKHFNWIPLFVIQTIIDQDKGGIGFFWSWSYWSTFILTWAVVPTIQGYEDAGDFTVKERLKTSVQGNLVFYLIVGSIGLFGLILLIIMHRNWSGGFLGLAMGCSNTFGLVTGAFLLGFSLSEIPKNIWRNADWTTRHKVLSHRVAKMAVKLDDAHKEFSNCIVVTQATSNQMSKRDPLRPYMDVIDNMLLQMFREDPSFKPQGGRLGENDMDYDTDEKSMAALRRQLRGAREEYYRYKSEYMTYVTEALELEDTIKNYERRIATGWKYVSSFRPSRTGKIGSFLDVIELVWRCILRKELKKLLAIILGCMSAAILLAEATILPSGVDLSLFSILINAVGKQEVLVQIIAFIPLMYMCVCTYYSLFKIGMLMFYSLTPRQSSSVNLLMICSMVARYAPPISYNFLNLIRLGEDKKTIFERTMGNIDQAVPFFGKNFNKIYPVIMVIYTLLVASNFFDRVINFFGSWKRFRIQNEADDTDGFDASRIIILEKERSWLEQGSNVGEHVIPLARNFNNTTMDLESGTSDTDRGAVEMRATTSLIKDDGKGNPSKSLKEETQKYGNSREAIRNKYTAIREQSREVSDTKSTKKNTASATVSLLDAANSQNRSGNTAAGPSSGLAKTWESMRTGFQNLKVNIDSKKFLPIRQVQEKKLISHVSSSESLDEIFQRLKRPNLDQGDNNYEDNDIDTRHSGPTR